jgi:hypothetical protein
MELRKQSTEERKCKQYVSNYAFYITHPVTVNTSTVKYRAHLVSDGNTGYVNCWGRTPSFFTFF